MKSRISEIWEHLLNQNSLNNGFVKTLVDPSFSISVFLALVFPKRSKALLIHLPQNFRNLPEAFTGKALKLEYVSLADSGSNYLILTLTDNSFSQVFDVFLEDCLNAISLGKSKVECLRVFTERLNRWRDMLETYSETGMSSSVQQGLFGELIVLMRLLRRFPTTVLELLTAWQGPDKFRQDFQFSGWAIEVKTTNTVDSITIANETQLSTEGLSQLFLWHLALDKFNGRGATLNDIVSELRMIVSGNIEADKLLTVRLAATGYYLHQTTMYDEVGYFIRQEKIYEISEGFPSLTTKNIPFGVTDVKYSIALSTCTPFVTTQESVYSTINF